MKRVRKGPGVAEPTFAYWVSENGKWEIEIAEARCDGHGAEADGYITNRHMRKYNAAWFSANSRGGVTCRNYFPGRLKLDLSTMGTSIKKKDIPQYVRGKALELADLAIIKARDSGGEWTQYHKPPRRQKSTAGWGSFSGSQFKTIEADPGPYNMIRKYIQTALERNARGSDAAVYNARGQYDLARKAEDLAEQHDVVLMNLARELGPRDYDYAENLLAKIQRGANVVWRYRDGTP